MKILITILVAILGISFVLGTVPTEIKNYQQHLTNIAQEINANNYGWKANEDISHWKNATKEELKKLNGLFPKKDGQSQLELVETVSNDIPETFDAREKWSQCESIKEIRDQANCGSCWAIAAAEVFSDRWCIASGQTQQTRMSVQNLLTCCDYCGNGCGGGWDDIAWLYFQNQGVVSGNLYGQNQYCQSYTLAPCDHHVKGPLGPCPPIDQTQKCSFSCSSEFKGAYVTDLHRTKGSGMTQSSVAAMQTEIMTNGPIEGSFMVYEDFLTYKSGVYSHQSGELDGGHAIKILGWGVENGQKYWLCANSWNTSWGDNGYFKILRGVNECTIENSASFGYADVKN